MADEGKIQIEKFNGTDFVWWKMQMEALLSQKDLDMVLEDKPEKMDAAAESAWNSKDKKARGAITLALTRSVAFNIMHETTARGMTSALSNMYEKPCAANKVFLMRELFMTRMNEGSSVTVYINNLNSILCRLSSVGIKFDDETKVVLLLSSLPDSWSGTVTVVTSSVRTTDMTFEGIRDIVLGEDVRRKSTGAGSSSEMLHVGRGRGNNRNSGSRGRSPSKTRKNVKCWSCNEVGHLRGLLGHGFRASFHAMDSGETMLNMKKGDFGKVRLANDELLEVTGMGDVDLVTSLGTTWNLKNVRVIPGLNRKLISVGQLDKQGMEVRCGSNEWKVVKGNLVIARGMKHGSLYLVDEPAEGSKEMLAERVQKSKPFRGFGDSGSKGCVPGTVMKSHWVLKTRTEECSPVGSLLFLESVGGPRCISGSGGVSIPVEIEDESLTGVVTTELELGGASTGPSFLAYSWELRLGRLVIEDYWIYWMTGLLMLNAGLDSITRPPSGRLLGFEGLWEG
ncbi:hypothetical protein E3N88_09659 [Mikania micrantha]|uniref:Retrovirus-related Pol polyprotein from transposon TNT 1-94-like beta-barrel domain-containing protein n=1 Tax=Mikania micrantha TaxID=192012 RepID=A0A5N6PLZ1_9ASTR|nr:hypothetical protein E3N88_09659 [Mikania micrantha]